MRKIKKFKSLADYIEYANQLYFQGKLKQATRYYQYILNHLRKAQSAGQGLKVFRKSGSTKT